MVDEMRDDSAACSGMTGRDAMDGEVQDLRRRLATCDPAVRSRAESLLRGLLEGQPPLASR